MDLTASRADRRRRSLGVAALTVTAHALLVVLALDRADGAVLLEPGGSSYATEFIDTGFWNAAWLLVPLAGVAAALWVWSGVLAVVLTTIAHTVAATITIQRYDAGGWSDGLEVLSYLWPIGHVLLGGGAVLAGTVIGRAHRRAQPAPGAAGRR